VSFQVADVTLGEEQVNYYREVPVRLAFRVDAGRAATGRMPTVSIPGLRLTAVPKRISTETRSRLGHFLPHPRQESRAGEWCGTELYQVTTR
jgi:hypothetical protein